MPEEPLLSTKDRPGAYDAIETAKPDEPLFALQGGDPFAPASIHKWVEQARAAATLEPDNEKREALLRKATNAEAVAWAMVEYQRGELAQARPAPVESAAPVTETALQLARLADKLHNALAEANDVAEALGPIPQQEGRVSHEWVRHNIRNAVALLKAAANDFEPRRHLRKEKADV